MDNIGHAEWTREASCWESAKCVQHEGADAGAEPGRLFFGSSNVMMKAEVREAGALEQYVTGSFLARTWARGANASEIELMYAETVRGQSRF